MVNNWYWGRGKAGPYTFITAEIISEKKYGYKPVTVFMLAQDGHVVADDQSKVTFAKSDIHTDNETGKPVANVHSFTYTDETDTYTLTYQRANTILRTHYIESLHGLKKAAARLLGFDGSYTRFSGTIDVAHHKSGGPTETISEPAIWELMYFGKHGHEAKKS
ncbi:hypothetical protein DB30_07965 [Enhygromyxa salina]|uniref:Diels-Alderase C-terminal domain-containing protein n=1 Tax=Enhygromyxa salina TaxID=215803 RepID=A0A0C2D037_9BACT|nr:hypothetical protein DB30_07965 [Enhygromyxa salina]